MKLKNEHFWLLIFALNFISFQLVQDYIRPQYMGNNIPIKYFLGVAPNFFPAIGIPSLFMVLIPILLINKPNSWFVLKRHLSSNLVSVTGLIGWEILQVTGKLVFDFFFKLENPNFITIYYEKVFLPNYCFYFSTILFFR